MDAVCYGFNLFEQIRSDKFVTVLSQFSSYGSPESLKSIKSIAFGWSRCYITFGKTETLRPIFATSLSELCVESNMIFIFYLLIRRPLTAFEERNSFRLTGNF